MSMKKLITFAMTIFAIFAQAGAPVLEPTQYQRLTTCQGGYWEEQQWFAGNFDNKGDSATRDDWAKVFYENGYISIDIHKTKSDGTTEMYRAYGTTRNWEPGTWFMADFNADGLADLGLATDYGGSWHPIRKFINYFDGKKHTFHMESWFSIQNQYNEQYFFLGNYDDSGSPDLYHIWRAYTVLDITVYPDYVYKAHAYHNQNYGHSGGVWVMADFNGDGRKEPAHIFDDGHNSTGVNVFFLSKTHSYVKRWGNIPIPFSVNEKWLVMDINNDGLIDLANVRSPNGLVYITAYLNNGSYVSPSAWTWDQHGYSPAQKWAVGDFNGDGRDDLGKVFNEGCASIDVHLNLE